MVKTVLRPAKPPQHLFRSRSSRRVATRTPLLRPSRRSPCTDYLIGGSALRLGAYIQQTPSRPLGGGDRAQPHARRSSQNEVREALARLGSQLALHLGDVVDPPAVKLGHLDDRRLEVGLAAILDSAAKLSSWLTCSWLPLLLLFPQGNRVQTDRRSVPQLPLGLPRCLCTPG